MIARRMRRLRPRDSMQYRKYDGPAAGAPEATVAASGVRRGLPTATGAAVNGETILIVDDSEINCSVLMAMLMKRDYRVRGVTSGSAAIESARIAPPDLILLDIAMPEINGYEVCQILKSDPRTDNIPIIFLSALDDPGDKVKAFQMGGFDYVVKPFESTELTARVANQLRLARLQRQMEAKNEEILRKNEEILRKNEEILEKSRRLFRMREELESAQDTVISVFASMSRTLLGKVLDEKYKLVEIIGSGGYGAVFRAVHTMLGRVVAVKVLQPGPAIASLGESIRVEGVSACSVNHPNAVKIWDAGVTKEGLAYLVMELLVGRTLRQEMSRDKPLSLERCAEVVLPVCEVLSVAHAANVVHRDIKPDNIFLHTDAGREVVKVVDFGIAKLMNGDPQCGDQATHTIEVIGTPEYVAPERFEAASYDGRADVYSLGVMLYEMLCGHLPFQTSREFRWAVASMHMDDPPPSLQEINPNIPSEVDEIVLRALAKDPRERPNAAEFGECFARAVSAWVDVERLRANRCG
jgi:eukaryotic-like serine/threonine-protein kinase